MQEIFLLKQEDQPLQLAAFELVQVVVQFCPWAFATVTSTDLYAHCDGASGERKYGMAIDNVIEKITRKRLGGRWIQLLPFNNFKTQTQKQASPSTRKPRAIKAIGVPYINSGGAKYSQGITAHNMRADNNSQ
jgi:nucleoid DNA-binding protein